MKPFKRSGSKLVVEDTSDGKLTVELDVDFDRRPSVNHFRTTDGHYTSDHEYRIDGTSVFCRLIEDRHGGPDVSEYKDVRDGAVLESAIRARNRATPRDYFHGFNEHKRCDNRIGGSQRLLVPRSGERPSGAQGLHRNPRG